MLKYFFYFHNTGIWPLIFKKYTEYINIFAIYIFMLLDGTLNTANVIQPSFSCIFLLLSFLSFSVLRASTKIVRQTCHSSTWALVCCYLCCPNKRSLSGLFYLLWGNVTSISQKSTFSSTECSILLVFLLFCFVLFCLSMMKN